MKQNPQRLYHRLLTLAVLMCALGIVGIVPSTATAGIGGFDCDYPACRNTNGCWAGKYYKNFARTFCEWHLFGGSCTNSSRKCKEVWTYTGACPNIVLDTLVSTELVDSCG